MNLFDGINENDKDAMLKCLDMQRILTVCSSACEFHTRLIHNLLTILTEKNLMLTHKIEHMAQKNTRDKLLSYLSMEAEKSGSAEFRIPFNRQQLADYLSVDRSAMSNELSKMRDEGLIKFSKNHFELLLEMPDAQSRDRER